MSRYDRPQNGRYREYVDPPPPPRRARYLDDYDLVSYPAPRRSPASSGGGTGIYDGPGGRMIIERPRERDRELIRDSDRVRERFRMTDRERENLKQRLSIPPVVSTTNPRQYRARSLSLSRSDSLADSDSDESPERRPDRYRRPGRDDHVGGGRFYPRDDHDRDRAYNSQPPPQRRPQVKYYHSERPLKPIWPLSRPESPVRDMRDRFVDSDRVYRVVERPLHHGGGDPMREMRFGVQRVGSDLGPRVGRPTYARSASIDGRVGNPGANLGMVVRRPGSGAGMRAVSPVRYHRPIEPQYTQVNVLILTWSFHDLKQASYTAPPTGDYISLEQETKRVRDTFESYGYKVREYPIPMNRSSEQLRGKLNQFCRQTNDDTLLIIYYHGHGFLDQDGELVFSSHEHPADPDWSRNAAAELYEALINGDSCPSHGRHHQYDELVKKYERYRPVSEVRWFDIRPTLLHAPSDLFLILDCCAAGGANLGQFNHLNWHHTQQHPTSRPPSPFNHPNSTRQRPYTKHLFAACGFESTTTDDMTAAMCEVLDEWAPDLHSGPGGGGVPFLTTKRLHQIMEERLQKGTREGSQPIFKQLLPADPEQYITLPNLNLEFGGGRGYGAGFGGYGDVGRGRVVDWHENLDRGRVGRELGWR